MSNEPNEQDDFWELLGKARRPTLPPGFAAQVISSISTFEAGISTGDLRSNRLHNSYWQRIILGAAAVAILSVGAFQWHITPHSTEDEQLLAAITAHDLSSSDLQLVSHLDEVLDSQLSALWLESH